MENTNINNAIDFSNPYEAVKILMKLGCDQSGALRIFNRMSSIFNNYEYYSEEAFEADQKEEKQKALVS